MFRVGSKKCDLLDVRARSGARCLFNGKKGKLRKQVQVRRKAQFVMDAPAQAYARTHERLA